MIVRKTVRVRRLSYALGTSVAALAAASASPAAAQCTPDPTQTYGSTTCTGTDEDGLVVATNGTRVIVAADALVHPGTALGAITSVASYNTSLVVNGQIDGLSKAGIAVVAGPDTTTYSYCDPYSGASVPTYTYCPPATLVTSSPSASLSVAVAEGATVTGAQALLLSKDAGNTSGAASATVDNAGTMTGSAGPALVNAASNGGTLSVNNRATGTIGGMTGNIDFVANTGVIDGGTNAAIASSAAALTLLNDTTGRIVSDVTTRGALRLTNAGTITGSVTSTAAAGQNSTIDTRTGTIGGNLVLGAGDDTLYAPFDVASSKVSAIGGTIDGGAGIDRIVLDIKADTTFGPLALPTNFEALGLDLSNNAVVTLTPAFTTSTGIALSGYGSVINQADLTISGPAITSGFNTSVSLDNRANIAATLSDSGQMAVSVAALTNTGTITASGGNGVTANSRIDNSGTITATGTAVTTAYGVLANTGTITSTAGIGVTIYSGFGSGPATNAGTISGATTGIAVSNLTLANTGTITGGTTGVALSSATLVNAAGGTVSGGTDGVLNAGFYARVQNAGTINGNVNLAVPGYFDSPSNDVYVDAGGTVNGAIRLGSGDDLLVTSLDSGTRPFAGATGGVDAGTGFDTLRYLVSADADADLALTHGFEGLGYEVEHGATLNLTATVPFTGSIGLAGTGTVTLDGTIVAAGGPAIDASIPTVGKMFNSQTPTVTDLTIVNNGAISLTRTDRYNFTPIAAVNAASARFTNAGTITVVNVEGAAYSAFAISGGTLVTNTGTITLTGYGTAISANAVVNTGTINAIDPTGSRAAGVAYFTSLNNSGTITADGTAVDARNNGYYGGAVTNSGTIASSGGSAVVLGGYYSSLVNDATGMIRSDAGGPTVDITAGGLIVNRGAIVGDVATSGYSYGPTTYVADGGTLTGDLTFSSGSDFFVMTSAQLAKGGTGVTGTIDGGTGYNTFGYALTSSASVSLDANAQLVNFRNAFVEVDGAGTVASITAAAPFAGTVFASGNGTVVNTATINGSLNVQTPDLGAAMPEADHYTLAAFDNRGTVNRDVWGSIGTLTNRGTLGRDPYGGDTRSTVSLLNGNDAVTFNNSGSVYAHVLLSSTTAITANNSGIITATGDGFDTPTLLLQVSRSATPSTMPPTVSLVNSGTIAATVPQGVTRQPTTAVWITSDDGTAAQITNTGTITAEGAFGVGLLAYNTSLNLNNSGTIRGANAAIITGSAMPIHILNSGTIDGLVYLDAGNDSIENQGTITGPVMLDAGNDTFTQYSNAKLGGVVDGGAGDDRFVMVNSGGGALDASQITGFEHLSQIGGGETSVAYSGSFGVDTIELLAGGAGVNAGKTLATTGPIVFNGATSTSDLGIDNAGTIAGSVVLGSGNDTVYNFGTIRGSVLLGAGNDRYVEGPNSVVTGVVDGGAGTDTYAITINGNHTGLQPRTGFEQLDVSGVGTLSLTLDQSFQQVVVTQVGLNVKLNGFTLDHIYGSSGADQVTVDGDVPDVSLGLGNDFLSLGASTLAGRYDSASGTLRFAAATPVTLTGTVTDFYTIELANGALTVAGTLGSPGQRMTFGDGAQSLTLAKGGALNGEISLAGGDDTFRWIPGGTINGTLDGGAGTDTATLQMAASPFTLTAGLLTGFEKLRTEGTGTLTLAGGGFTFDTVDMAGDLTIAARSGLTTRLLTFGARNDTLTIANLFSGTADLGAGDDTLLLDTAFGVISGTIDGGAGTDTATLQMAAPYTLSARTLTGFERLNTTGAGALTLAGGAFAFDTVNPAGDLAVAQGASLTAGRVGLGAGDNRLTIAGTFAGSVAGGAGTDTIEVSGNAAFATVSDIEALRMSAGLATVSGTASLGSIALAGGRLTGLAGSTITASTIQVAQGATFGSAGTVNGNIAVAGTLSPGASPGTMTVNGNVALAGTSVSVFEITPTVSDKLVINGALSIAQGATLQIVADTAVQPGRSLDLITASGGITGSFTNVIKPASLFGFLVQRGGTIALLGQFLNDPAFSAPVRSTIDYVNTVLTSGAATSAFLAAAPRLVTATGATDQTAFALLTPEAYASAGQIAVEQGLELAATGRSAAFAPNREGPGAFTFASALGSTRTLERATNGTAPARTNGYGLLGGLGYAGTQWSIGGFVGYLNSRQTLLGRGARTELDGIVAGVHARWSGDSGIGVKATLAYAGGKAATRRALPLSGSASADYDLTGWTADASVDYALALSGNWTVRPSLGVTAIRTTRDAVTEDGGSPFALAVARERDHAVFVDGALTFTGGMRQTATVRPYLSVGVRYQVDGRTPYALAALGGGGYGLLAAGASRAAVLATATVGADVALTSRLTLFGSLSGEAGDADNRASARTGLRLAF
ncbi:hypothetical protein [Novosphingobium sp. Leaf2]|uniref:hypothetical protein n=1 Tax=Novosphingobium sp. Leaf2 TaxID=1735670 RepID=UPI0006F23626|nr:hypothetical protein [Novosphingobium sp. Leaf2]KQM21536.1 hypothetical protein ASE49_14105 [Novosphingobium sp. Leaf2]